MIHLRSFSLHLSVAASLLLASLTLTSCRSISHKQTLRHASSTELYSAGREKALIKDHERLFYFIALKGTLSSMSEEKILATLDVLLDKLPEHLPRSTCYVIDHQRFNPPTLSLAELRQGSGLDQAALERTIQAALEEGGGLMREEVEAASGGPARWRYTFSSLDAVFCRFSVVLDLQRKALQKAGLHDVFYIFHPQA